MTKLKMHSLNKVDKNIEAIGALFPNCLTERKGENGEVEMAIDFDVLRQELSAVVVEGPQERYQFTWPEKRKSILLANQPIAKTLRPCREESKDFDTTENLYIEGDNLDVLKMLQETYLGKVKMIYIDPPYNTGNDFVYEDDYSSDVEWYRKNSGDFDDAGNRMVKNLDSNGRFHTDWLNMIYPRLKVARDLLTDDGVIFISIDDNEVENLKKICDEVFGASNFVAQLIWKKKKGGGNDSVYIATEHEYVLMYAKNLVLLPSLFHSFSSDYLTRYKEEDRIGRFFWDTFKRKSGKQYYAITCPDGTILENDELGNPISWLRSEPRFKEDLKSGDVRIVKVNDGWSVQFKQRIPEGKKPRSILVDYGTTSDGSGLMLNLFGKHYFDNPKPLDLLKHLCEFGLGPDSIILDFFSGSATTAHAVMQLNAEDGGNRKFICVQLPEKTDEKSEAYKAGYANICEIGKERIRRAGASIMRNYECAMRNEADAKNNSELSIKHSALDTGFRVLKSDSTNMKDVYYNPSEITAELFDELVDNIKEDRTPEDLLFQVMLDLGILLSANIEQSEIAGKKVFSVDGGYLIASFDSGITEQTIEAIAKQKPYYFAMRDSSMASDSLAINFEQIFKTYSPETICKVL